MRYLLFGEAKPSYSLCILVNNINKDKIEKAYITPFGINPDDVIVIQLHQTHDGNGKGKKTTAGEMKKWINDELIEVLNDLNVQYLAIADGDYFKTITKSPKVDAYLGYVLPTEFGPWKCVYTPTYESIFYDPEKARSKIATAFEAIKSHATGTYTDPGHGIIEFAEYPSSVEEISGWLETLITESRPLTCDIETFSLKHVSAGIGTIAFAWNQKEGIAIPVDILNDPIHSGAVRALLRSFFERFRNNITFHKISFDVGVLIYQLFMKDILDTEGLLHGMNVMLRDWDDTLLITYLATNSCAGNKLKLKQQAQEFAGNYAVEEIKDIRKVPLSELLEYNLVDCLSTWYVKDKHYQTMLNDDQEDIYVNIFKPATVDIIQMQLTGLPVNMERVKQAKAEMEIDSNKAVQSMLSNPLVQEFSYSIIERYVEKKNAEWVKKRITVDEAIEAAKTKESVRKEISFNPNSGPQLIRLLFDMIGLPVLEKTDSGEPATDNKTLTKLKNHTDNPDVISLLEALLDYGAVNKILTSTIPAFEAAVQGSDGWYYVFGNFNLGGTLSGRLSSSDPNLQNLPASSKYAKLIKWCVQAPPGWFWCGIDFASLEDRISALTTKDPNKLKVYTDGYDGHCLRAYAYFKQHMPDIDPSSVASINSIQTLYGSFRTKSKNPTFALTYQGTYGTLMRNYGFTEELAKNCEAAYQDLYKVSVQWVNQKLDAAMTDGYITGAFGLRVRTPLLAQVIRGTKKTPHEAEAEGRSAGNALGQSWCLLNSRACSEFMGKVRKSEHRLDIRVSAQIHDAMYFLIRDDIDIIMFTNEHLIKAVQWQEHPDIQHDEVKLGGEFSIFYPDWSKEMGIPNGATVNQVYEAVAEHMAKLNK